MAFCPLWHRKLFVRRGRIAAQIREECLDLILTGEDFIEF